jgi:hypothetical protein
MLYAVNHGVQVNCVVVRSEPASTSIWMDDDLVSTPVVRRDQPVRDQQWLRAAGWARRLSWLSLAWMSGEGHRPEDVDELTGRARAAGARVTKEPVAATFFEGRDAYFAEPEGNFWEVAWSAGDNPVVAAARRAAGR